MKPEDPSRCHNGPPSVPLLNTTAGSSVFCDVMRRKFVVFTDVSGQLVGSIIRGTVTQEEITLILQSREEITQILQSRPFSPVCRFHLRLGLRSSFLPSGFLIPTLCISLVIRICATCLAQFILFKFHHKGKVKIIPMHALKHERGSGDSAPLILNLATASRLVLGHPSNTWQM